MAKTETVKLTEPVLWHDRQLTELTLREPRARDFFAFGEPMTWARTGDGNAVSVENPDVIGRYLDACIVHEGGSALLGLVGLTDAFALKDAVLGFFVAARLASLPADATSSSSTSTP